MAKERPTRKPLLYKLLLIAGVGILLFIEVLCGLKVRDLSAAQKEYNSSYAEVINVSYGLLSVDVWREQIVSAARQEIGQYRLTPEQQVELRKEINQLLRTLVAHAFEVINRPQKSIGGKLRKLVVKTFVNKEKIEKQVPGYTDKLMAEITKPATFKKIATLADTALSQMGRESYDSSVAATKHLMDSIFHKYGATDRASYEQVHQSRLKQIHKDTYNYAFGMLGCIVAVLLLWLVLRKKRDLHFSLYILSVVSAMILLVVGLSTTMIEIDARIATMNLHFLGKEIVFKDQGLFFQSKSIIDVVMLLLETGKFDSQAVGVLILVFSVLFPFTKLAATAVVLASEDKWGKKKWIRYFAFESGKWSMADVMVVAILMTYIGFNGIVHKTLSGLRNVPNVTTITTSNTSVQPGYIIFIAFVIYGFVLSAILKKITKNFTIK
ncbi:paraquat-inducible protein A [Sediminibacterium roseum]|uniref:Paraquat-inducible protein A n=1 Tax=Sediminibacterium roseum TaxID=1978412 RepID=A0ABW9ZWN2_9BACT|nr:paraquat-inducible protein A [Sediminibacterium roseum]NCI50940.1 paraquat-inducible protein A [Sediminibacterium roseum]